MLQQGQDDEESAEDEFARMVIDRFASDYAAGRTPVPCVACNKDLKFGSLLRRARAWDAAAVATGHYARTVRHRGRLLLARALVDSSPEVAVAEARGLNILMNVHAAPGWATGGNTATGAPPTDPTTLQNFMAMFAARYRGRTAGQAVWEGEELRAEIARQTAPLASRTDATMLHLRAMLIYAPDDPRAGHLVYPTYDWFQDEKRDHKQTPLRPTL